jgi:DHA1 family bicyclomycin/chloramphenicol resistance-like MFS transporter
MLMAVAPAVAPTLGALMLEVLPWPSLFVFLAAYGVMTACLVHFRLAESLPEPQSLHPAGIARNYAVLLRDAPYCQATIASALMYAGMIAFLSSSAFVFIGMLGVPTRWFGLVFTSTVAGYFAGSALSARLARSRSSEQIMRSGALLGTLAALVMMAASELYRPTIAGLLLPMMLYSCSLGLVLPHAMGSALRHFPQMAGTASALFGFVQMGLSGATAALVAWFLDSSPRPMVTAMLLVSLASLGLILRLHRNHRPAASLPD